MKSITCSLDTMISERRQTRTVTDDIGQGLREAIAVTRDRIDSSSLTAGRFSAKFKNVGSHA